MFLKGLVAQCHWLDHVLPVTSHCEFLLHIPNHKSEASLLFIRKLAPLMLLSNKISMKWNFDAMFELLLYYTVYCCISLLPDAVDRPPEQTHHRGGAEGRTRETRQSHTNECKLRFFFLSIILFSSHKWVWTHIFFLSIMFLLHL